MKVLAIASMFNALFVRNFVAMLNSGELNYSSRKQLRPSFSDKVSQFQLEVRSSMVIRKKHQSTNGYKTSLFPRTPRIKNPTSLRITLLSQGVLLLLPKEGTSILL